VPDEVGCFEVGDERNGGEWGSREGIVDAVRNPVGITLQKITHLTVRGYFDAVRTRPYDASRYNRPAPKRVRGARSRLADAARLGRQQASRHWREP